jgi:hypothetical protein
MKFKFLFVVGLSIMSVSNAQLFKVSNQGNILSSVSLNHSCVLDDNSQLMWEAKLNTKGLQNSKNTYTWFDTKTGTENGDYSHNCNWTKGCNTQAYVNAINTAKLCKQNNWRLPTEDELRTLLVYSDDDLLIDKNFFQHTQLKSYWSSDQQNTDIAIDVPFFYGGSKSSDKSFDSYVRLVRDVN